MKKIIKTLLWTLLALMLLIAAGAWMKFGSLVKGAMSVQKLDEGLYYMEYKGDDGFAGLIESGGGKSSGELVELTL